MLIDLPKLERYPPFLVRALARNSNGHELTTRECAELAGLSVRNFDRISSKGSWMGVKLSAIVSFCCGCNFDLKCTRKQFDYLRGTARAKLKFSHLSPLQRRRLERRIVEWQTTNKNQQ